MKINYWNKIKYIYNIVQIQNLIDGLEDQNDDIQEKVFSYWSTTFHRNYTKSAFINPLP